MTNSWTIPSDEEAKAFTQAYLAAQQDYYDNPQTQTNYDSLISKTPEKLVEWIISIEPAACPYATWGYNDDCNKTDCRQCWLDWMGEEATNG